MGFFRPTNDGDPEDEPSVDEDDLVEDEVRDEAGEPLAPTVDEAEPPV